MLGAIVAALSLSALAQVARQQREAQAIATWQQNAQAQRSKQQHGPRPRSDRQLASVSAQLALRDGNPLELNHASAHDLELLPGLGPNLARRIVEARGHRGRFTNLEELRSVRGIGARTLERLRPFLRVEAQGSSSHTTDSVTPQ